MYSANFVLKKLNIPIGKRKTKNEKKLVKSLKKSFSISKYLETFFVFVFQTKTKRNNVFFRGAIKNELFDHKKPETLTSLALGMDTGGTILYILNWAMASLGDTGIQYTLNCA